MKYLGLILFAIISYQPVMYYIDNNDNIGAVVVGLPLAYLLNKII